MIFVLTMLFTFVYDRKNENHWSLLITRYSLLEIQTPFNVCIHICIQCHSNTSAIHDIIIINYLQVVNLQIKYLKNKYLYLLYIRASRLNQ